MPESPKPIPIRFWRSAKGREPVREWLNQLPREDQRTIGRDIAKVQYGWPIGSRFVGLSVLACGKCAHRFQAGVRLEFYSAFTREC